MSFLFAAAAWYMAKRRFYNKGVKNQLLALLLKEYPKKFAMKNNVVQFLESYSPVVSFVFDSVIFHFLSTRFLSDCSIKTAILGWARAIRVLFSQSWWVWSLLFWPFVSRNFGHIQTCSFSTSFHFSQVLRRNRTFPCWNANCDKYLQQRNSAVNPQLLQAIQEAI